MKKPITTPIRSGARPLRRANIDRFLHATGSKVAYNGTQEQILLQKWVSLFLQGFGIGSDYRRTGYPKLPGAGAVERKRAQRTKTLKIQHDMIRSIFSNTYSVRRRCSRCSENAGCSGRRHGRRRREMTFLGGDNRSECSRRRPKDISFFPPPAWDRLGDCRRRPQRLVDRRVSAFDGDDNNGRTTPHRTSLAMETPIAARHSTPHGARRCGQTRKQAGLTPKSKTSRRRKLADIAGRPSPSQRHHEQRREAAVDEGATRDCWAKRPKRRSSSSRTTQYSPNALARSASAWSARRLQGVGSVEQMDGNTVRACRW